VTEIAAIFHKRRAAVDKARITLNRNSVLRGSSRGRLLLVLERCVLLVNSDGEMHGRRASQLLNELRYACQLGDRAGVRNGWVREGSQSFVAYELSCGDVVFPTFNETVGTDGFSREPVAFSNNSWVVARSITKLLTEQKSSAQRRSTRIPTNVHVEVQSAGSAYAGETITVNAHGALVRLAAPLKLGDRITLHVERTGKSAPASVVFANLSQFGIELQKPENIWGIAAPPTDWDALSESA
jgi:PilZ domain